MKKTFLILLTLIFMSISMVSAASTWLPLDTPTVVKYTGNWSNVTRAYDDNYSSYAVCQGPPYCNLYYNYTMISSSNFTFEIQESLGVNKQNLSDELCYNKTLGKMLFMINATGNLTAGNLYCWEGDEWYQLTTIGNNWNDQILWLENQIPVVTIYTPNTNATNVSKKGNFSVIAGFVDAENATLNCSLFVNGTAVARNDTLHNGTLDVYTFSVDATSLLPPGNKSFQVQCRDDSGTASSDMLYMNLIDNDPIVGLVTPNIMGNGSYSFKASNIFTVTFNQWDDEDSSSNCSLYVNNNYIYSNGTTLNMTETNMTYTPTSLGMHTFYVECNNTYGGDRSEVISFNLTNTAPTVGILYPSNGTTINYPAIISLIYFTDPDDLTANCSIYLNGTYVMSNDSMDNNSPDDLIRAWTIGQYWFQAICNDGWENGTSTNISVTIGGNKPEVSFGVNPTNNTITTNTTLIVPLIFIDNDSSTALCGLVVDGSLVDSNSSTDNATMTNFSTTLAVGEHTYYGFCRDSDTNLDVTGTITITIISTADAAAGASCRTTKTIIYAGFGLIAVGIIVLAGFLIISLFRGEGSGTDAVLAVVIGSIATAVVVMAGYYLIDVVANSICTMGI